LELGLRLHPKAGPQPSSSANAPMLPPPPPENAPPIDREKSHGSSSDSRSPSEPPVLRIP
jgi:hypothetical protein